MGKLVREHYIGLDKLERLWWVELGWCPRERRGDKCRSSVYLRSCILFYFI